MTTIRNKIVGTILVFAIMLGVGTPKIDAALLVNLAGDGSAADSSGSGHHGTLVGDTTFAPGVIGSAFLLDGSGDYITIPNSPALEPTSAFSAAAWVSMGPISGQVLIVDSSHGFTDLNGWMLQTSDSGQIGFGYGNGISFPEVRSITEIDDGTFHHVAGVFDGSSLRIYVDGVNEGMLPYAGSPQASGREIRIGASWGGGATTREVNGLIDDVRIYNHALSAAEVSALVTAVPEPSSLGLITLIGMVSLSYQKFKSSRASNNRAQY